MSVRSPASRRLLDGAGQELRPRLPRISSKASAMKSPDPRSIVGRRFGRLVARKSIGREPETGYDVWEFVCGCGAPVVRALWKVRSSERSGHDPMCPKCRDRKLAEARTASVVRQALM